MIDQNQYFAAVRRIEQRKLAQERRQREIEEAKKAAAAPPPTPTDNKHLAQIARAIASNEQEIKRIERIRDTDIQRYYEDKLDMRYAQLTST